MVRAGRSENKRCRFSRSTKGRSPPQFRSAPPRSPSRSRRACLRNGVRGLTDRLPRDFCRRVLEIAELSRKLGEEAQAGVKRLYRRLMGTTPAVLREGRKAVGQAKRQAKKRATRVLQRVQGLTQQAKWMSAFTQRVLEQTKAAC